MLFQTENGMKNKSKIIQNKFAEKKKSHYLCSPLTETRPTAAAKEWENEILKRKRANGKFFSISG